MIKFGPSGNSDSFYRDGRKNTFEAPQWLSEKGLNAYEYSFGRGINVSDETARKIGEKCKEFGVELSVHAPYYVNLANPDDEMAKKSFGYIVNSAKKLMQFGGNRVIFHPASVGKATREQAVKLTMQRMYALRDEIYKNNLQHLTFCPEVMGKINQIGDLEEVLNFCTIDPCFVPTIDFGHLNARTHGLLKTQKDFEQAIEKSIEIIVPLNGILFLSSISKASRQDSAKSISLLKNKCLFNQFLLLTFNLVFVIFFCKNKKTMI